MRRLFAEVWLDVASIHRSLISLGALLLALIVGFSYDQQTSYVLSVLAQYAQLGIPVPEIDVLTRVAPELAPLIPATVFDQLAVQVAGNILVAGVLISVGAIIGDVVGRPSVVDLTLSRSGVTFTTARLFSLIIVIAAIYTSLMLGIGAVFAGVSVERIAAHLSGVRDVALATASTPQLPLFLLSLVASVLYLAVGLTASIVIRPLTISWLLATGCVVAQVFALATDAVVVSAFLPLGWLRTLVLDAAWHIPGSGLIQVIAPPSGLTSGVRVMLLGVVIASLLAGVAGRLERITR